MLYPSGRYNLNFDISALLLSGFLLVYCLVHPRVRQERRARIFLLLLVNLLLSSGSELAAGILFNLGVSPGETVLLPLSIFIHISQLSQPYLLVIYLLEVLGFSRGLSAGQYAAIALPELAMVLSFLVPPIRRALFGSTAEEQIFERARNAFFGAIVLFCLAFAVGVLHRTRRAIRRWTFLQSLILIVCFLISILPQLLDHYLNATVFLQTLCMLGMYLILENSTDLFDAGSGFRTRTALWQESGVLFARHMPAAMVCVKLRDSGYLSMVLGAPTVNQLSREIGIYLQQFAGTTSTSAASPRGPMCSCSCPGRRQIPRRAQNRR